MICSQLQGHRVVKEYVIVIWIGPVTGSASTFLDGVMMQWLAGHGCQLIDCRIYRAVGVIIAGRGGCRGSSNGLIME